MKQFDTVEKALDELKQGHLILVTDDEDRENEGDLICAASFATTENVRAFAAAAAFFLINNNNSSYHSESPFSCRIFFRICFPVCRLFRFIIA